MSYERRVRQIEEQDRRRARIMRSWIISLSIITLAASIVTIVYVTDKQNTRRKEALNQIGIHTYLQCRTHTFKCTEACLSIAEEAQTYEMKLLGLEK